MEISNEEFEKEVRLRKLYDAIPVKDASFEWFKQQYTNLSSPVSINAEMGSIMLQKKGLK